MENISIFNPETIPFWQILLAMILGSVLGLERSFAGKTAGMRTYGLVAMGSCLFVVVSLLMNETFIGITDFDPMRVAAGVITGIGFIGAGLIIFQEKDSRLKGLTTAAGLWVACGIGMAVGFGLYAISIFATILTLFNFTVLWFVEHKFKKVTAVQKDPLQGI